MMGYCQEGYNGDYNHGGHGGVIGDGGVDGDGEDPLFIKRELLQ